MRRLRETTTDRNAPLLDDASSQSKRQCGRYSGCVLIIENRRGFASMTIEVTFLSNTHIYWDLLIEIFVLYSQRILITKNYLIKINLELTISIQVYLLMYI